MGYDLYPNDWSTIASDIKRSCNYQCMACGKQCQRPGELNLGWQYRLTVAHLCQDYEAEVVCVAALCLPCHLAYDAPHSWIARQRQQRWRMRAAGQLEINYYR